MNGRLIDIDVIVVGGGPSGCATAIWCALHNLKVVLIESKAFPRHRPGETLHPGIEVILRQLGVDQLVKSSSKVRHTGVYLKARSQISFIPYGEDVNGIWRGYQVLRSDLDQILLERARLLGVKILQPCKAERPIIKDRRVIGVISTYGELYAKYVVDGGGAGHWLKKHLNLKIEYYSSKLLVKYGYCEGELHNEKDNNPSFSINSHGWIWTAKIHSNLYHWSRLLSSKRTEKEDLIPESFSNLKVIGNIRGADVSWRFIPCCAGPGFLAGDSAIVFDPSVSKGVLRGFYSGIRVAANINQIITGNECQNNIIEKYKEWMRSWFLHDLQQMENHYKIFELK